MRPMVFISAIALAWLCGCNGANWSRMGSHAGRVQPGGNPSTVAELSRSLQAGDYEHAHKLVAQQSAASARGDDRVMALWWRCQDLRIYYLEGNTSSRMELAGLLAGDPASKDTRFLLSSGWADLLMALVDADRQLQSQRLLSDRYEMFMQMDDKPVWWHRQMADLSARARLAGDEQLASLAASQVRLPAHDPCRRLLAPTSAPDRRVFPKQFEP